MRGPPLASTAAAPATATASATLSPSGFIAMTRASGRPSRTFSASGISNWIEPSAPRVWPSARRTASWNARRNNAPATVASAATAANCLTQLLCRVSAPRTGW